MRRLSPTCVLLICLAALTAFVQAQDKPLSVPTPPAATPTPPAAPQRTPRDFLEFFAGEWSGIGDFGTDKQIESEITFTPELDNQWLVYHQTDRTTNYKTRGTLGVDRSSGQFVMILNDNFGGVRLFVSEGWANGKIVFERVAMSKPLTSQERFTFERRTDDSFRLAYETRRDGQATKIGNYLFSKKKK